MRGVRTLLAAEIDFGIAVLVGGAGHRVCLGFGLGGLVIGGVVSGRITRPLTLRRGTLCLRLEALHRRPGLDQRAVDREVLVRQKRRDLAMRQD